MLNYPFKAKKKTKHQINYVPLLMLHAFGKYIIDTCPHFSPSRDDKLHIGVHSATLNELLTEFRVRNGGLSFMGGRNRWQRAFD